MKAKQSQSANRLELAPFPLEGKVRAKQAAPFLGIGVSTLWLYVSQGRIKAPMRVSVHANI